MPVIEGAIGAPLQSAGVPSTGTSEIQTLTIGGTPESGDILTFTFDGFSVTAAWNATNATLVANIDAALESLNSIGTGGVAVAVGTATAGVGTFTITFGGNRAKQAVNLITASISNADGDGSAGTAAITETTPGVTATGRGAPKGALLVDTTNGVLYINTGTGLAPTWTVVGAQT